MSADRNATFVKRHDLVVVLVALALLALAALAHRALAAPEGKRHERLGLSITTPGSWVGQAGGDTLPSVTRLASVEDGTLGLELAVRKRPGFDGPIESVLELERAQEHGALYTALAGQQRTVAGKAWWRTEFGYATKVSDGDLPSVVHGVEYALVHGERLYVVTLHGDRERVLALEPEILGTLDVK
jgi:hypothetical protein